MLFRSEQYNIDAEGYNKEGQRSNNNHKFHRLEGEMLSNIQRKVQTGTGTHTGSTPAMEVVRATGGRKTESAIAR